MTSQKAVAVALGAASAVVAATALIVLARPQGPDAISLFPLSNGTGGVVGHFVAAAALGAVMAALFPWRPRGQASLLVAGMLTALLWWVVGPLTIATWLQGCLLYTSPSPRDATLSRMPSSA